MNARESESAGLPEDAEQTLPKVSEPQQRIRAALQSFRNELEATGVDIRQLLSLRDLAGEGVHQLDRFQIDQLIGQGGCGSVYRAYDPQLDRWVALKVPLPHLAAKADFRHRFLFEAQAMARLSHPNIVPVYEVGGADHVDSPCYLASQLCDGISLATWIADHPTVAQRTAVIAVLPALADALDHVHRSGIVHRDIKPSNILLFRKPDADPADRFPYTAKLTDFGLAKSTADVGRHNTTIGVAGTLKYMSPEQVLGKRKQIGPATDIYAFGAVLYELLTGAVPFDSENAFDLSTKIVNDDPRQLPGTVPSDLASICLRCLRKDPQSRYASAHDLAEDLRRSQDGQPPRDARTTTTRSAKKLRLASAVAGIATASLAIALVFSVRTTDSAVSMPQSKANGPNTSMKAFAKLQRQRFAKAPVNELFNAYLQSGGSDEILSQVVGLSQQEPVRQFVHPVTKRKHAYQLVTLQRPITWQRAAELASRMTYQNSSGHLATITDVDQADFIRVEFLMNRLSARTQRVWIGLSRDAPQLPWRWITGQPLSPEYQDWFPGAMDNQMAAAVAYHWDDTYGVPYWRWGQCQAQDPAAFHFLVEYEKQVE